MTSASVVSRCLSAKRSVVRGSSALRNCLVEQRSPLQNSPLVVVSSQPGLESIPQVQQACDFASFVASQELGLRTVPVGLESALPTPVDIGRGIELIQRTGAGAVLGVGSGAAIDLAKALAATSGSEKLVLAPATLGAALAAGSSQSLLLETKEETIVPSDSDLLSNADLETLIVLDEKAVYRDSNEALSRAAYAALAMAFDTIYTNGAVVGNNSNESISMRASLEALEALENKDETTAGRLVVESLYHAGLSLEYGIPASQTNFRRRSIPLALSCSILPISFPHSHPLPFMASLLPGLHETLVSRAPPSTTNEEVDALLKQMAKWVDSAPSLSSLSVDSSSAQPVPALMKQVRNNQTVWDCRDAPNDVLEEILHRSLNR